MYTRVVRFRQEAVVVPRDAEPVFAVADWFEDAVAAKVEKAEAFNWLQVLRRNTHAVNQHAGSPAKILRTFETRVACRLFVRPGAQSHAIDQGFEIASLNGRVANYDFRGVGTKHGFHCGSNHRGV